MDNGLIKDTEKLIDENPFKPVYGAGDKQIIKAMRSKTVVPPTAIKNQMYLLVHTRNQTLGKLKTAKGNERTNLLCDLNLAEGELRALTWVLNTEVRL